MNLDKLKGNANKKIIRAENSGFCFGVKQAVDKAHEVLEESEQAVYVCGDLIHNKDVTDELEEKGLRVVNGIDEVPQGAMLIVRSHGEGKIFFEAADNKGIKIIDCTCPYVSRIHLLSKEANDAGKQVLIVGDPRHPEVIGINGWSDDNAIIVSSFEEAESVKEKDLFVVSQTTLEKEFFDRIIEILVKNNKQVNINNTICNATKLRQTSTYELASKCDAMVIVGGKNSSNSRKLYEIAKKACDKTFFVENISNLPLKDLFYCNTIGITAGASTPERIIKEVIYRMSEGERNLMHDFMDEIEKSLRLPRSGEIVTGEVIQVSDGDVVINLGCKKDGIIPKNEVALEDNQTLEDVFKEGDEVQAKVIKTDDGDGNILLSKKRVVISEHWKDINNAYDNKEILEVKVIREVNGGVIASYKEVSGFVPMSQLSDRYVEKADGFIGKTLTVRVTRVDQRKNKVVFSHKAVLSEERAKKLEQIWATLKEGDVIEGEVMRFTDYGAFVDIGGIDGLLHISEISWGKLKHPKEVLTIGETIKVKVLSINEEKEKISLGYKQNQPEPWSVIEDKYAVGQVIDGKAVQIKDYGVFVELEPGLDGLVHISEIAHKRVNNINDEISVGQDISAKILEIDKERKRISLSIKETLPLPTEDDDTETLNESPVEETVAEETSPEAPVEEPAVEEASSENEAAEEAKSEENAPAEEAPEE